MAVVVLRIAARETASSCYRSGPTLMLVPLAHMTVILVIGAACFYLMHIFAR